MTILTIYQKMSTQHVRTSTKFKMQQKVKNFIHNLTYLVKKEMITGPFPDLCWVQLLELLKL